MKKHLVLILSGIALFGVLIGLIINQYRDPKEMVDVYNTLGQAKLLGASVPKRPTEFTSSLAQQLTEGHSGTTLKVTTITTKDGNTLSGSVLGTRIVLSVNPGASNSEVVVCSGLTTATKTFTGCTFGYRFDDPSLTSSSNIEAHSPGEPVIISNTDTYNATNFLSATGDHNVLGLLTFDQYPQASSTLGNATGTLQFVTLSQANNIASAGAATSTESVTGIVRLATQIQMASSSYDALIPTALYSRYATSSPYTTGLWAVISENNGQLSSSWFTQGNASTSFYGLTASGNNLNNIGWYGNAFRDIFASGTLYAGGLTLSGSSALTAPYFTGTDSLATSTLLGSLTVGTSTSRASSLVIDTRVPGDVGLQIRGTADQTANLLQLFDKQGAATTTFNKNGALSLGGGGAIRRIYTFTGSVNPPASGGGYSSDTCGAVSITSLSTDVGVGDSIFILLDSAPFAKHTITALTGAATPQVMICNTSAADGDAGGSVGYTFLGIDWE